MQSEAAANKRARRSRRAHSSLGSTTGRLPSNASKDDRESLPNARVSQETARLSAVDEAEANVLVQNELNLMKIRTKPKAAPLQKLRLQDFHNEQGPDRDRLMNLHLTSMLNETRQFFASRTKKRNQHYDRPRDSLDDLEFDDRPITGFRFPMLEKLDPKSLKTFRRELEAAEEMRQEMNVTREIYDQISRPEPRMLVERKLWGYATVELKKYNPNITHFLDATFEDLEDWLLKATVQVPNHRPFLKRLNDQLAQAWSESYLFGLPKFSLCMMPEARNDEEYVPRENEDEDAIWDLNKDVKKTGDVDSKKLSTTSSVTMFSWKSSHRFGPSDSLTTEEFQYAQRPSEDVISDSDFADNGMILTDNENPIDHGTHDVAAPETDYDIASEVEMHVDGEECKMSES